MKIIIDSGFKYNLWTHNCSSTSLSVLKAGKERRTFEVSPPKIVAVVTPQMVYNEAMLHRERICNVSLNEAIDNLNKFYSLIKKSFEIQVVARKTNNLRETILNFAIDNIFPEQSDVTNKIFYGFSSQDKVNLDKIKNEIIPTELLRDLWGIVPMRTLPLSEDGSNNVVIDKNMTMGELVQGLTILAKNNAENTNVKK